MRVLITGSERGQLFFELHRRAPEHAQLLKPASRIDISDRGEVSRAIESLQPQLIFNAAAYTAVDKAESEPELAYAVNATGVGHLADAADKVGAHLLHVSTDFVFGPGSGLPFSEDSPVAPVSVYGKTKLAGERILAERLPEASAIFRTAWVHSSHGSNFVKSMLKLMSERDELGVVADQIGAPTWARSLADALWLAAEQRLCGLYHWSGAGVASWYDFAIAIKEEATSSGMLDRDTRINPLRSDQYPTAATRPNYSVLELTRTWQVLGLTAEHWRHDLRLMLRELT